MIYEFNGYRPVIHESAFVHPQATIIGNTIIGKDVYVGPSAVVRADWGQIVVEDGCNIQENCTVHMFPGITMYLRKSAHIGHGAIIHGANVGENSLIGMNAVLMDHADIGKECIIGALAFIRTGQIIPNRSLVVGNPAKIIRQVSDDMLNWKTKGTELYQELPGHCKESLKECSPLRKIPKNIPPMEQLYKTWKK